MLITRFASGNPLILFQSAATAALNPSNDDIREYPADPLPYWHKKFSESAVPAFLEETEIRAPNRMHGSDLVQTISFALGVLHAVTMTTAFLLKSFEKLNVARVANGLKQLKPAIIAPVPTYTFPFDFFRKNNVAIIQPARNIGDGWSLDPQKIATLLENLRRENEYHVIGYYDSNPNNPTGCIRNTTETATFAEVFHEHNMEMNKSDQVIHKGLTTHDHRRSITHRLSILDDMIYLGLEHCYKKAASFLANPKTANDTVVFLGVSKYGLPGIRGALIITHPKRKRQLFRQFWESVGYAPASSLIATATVFSGDSRRLYDREEHLRALNSAHWHGFQVFRALINGVNDEFLNGSTGQKVMDDVMLVVRDQERARQQLIEGIPGLKVENPESGFFALLDARNLWGMRMPINDRVSTKHQGHSLGSVAILHRYLKDFGVEYLRGDTCGLETHQLFERASFGLPPRDIIAGLDATREAIRVLNPMHSHGEVSPA